MTQKRNEKYELWNKSIYCDFHNYTDTDDASCPLELMAAKMPFCTLVFELHCPRNDENCSKIGLFWNFCNKVNL